MKKILIAVTALTLGLFAYEDAYSIDTASELHCGMYASTIGEEKTKFFSPTEEFSTTVKLYEEGKKLVVKGGKETTYKWFSAKNGMDKYKEVGGDGDRIGLSDMKRGTSVSGKEHMYIDITIMTTLSNGENYFINGTCRLVK